MWVLTISETQHGQFHVLLEGECFVTKNSLPVAALRNVRK